MKSSWVISHVNAVFVSNTPKTISIIRGWCDEWSVHTPYLYTKLLSIPAQIAWGRVDGICSSVMSCPSTDQWQTGQSSEFMLPVAGPSLQSSFKFFHMFYFVHGQVPWTVIPYVVWVGIENSFIYEYNMQITAVITSTNYDKDNQKYWTWTPHWHSWLPEKTPL
jgi:hypothetical protein